MMTRADLISFVTGAQNIPPLIRSIAGAWLMALPEKEINQLAVKAEAAKSAIDQGDWQQVERIAHEAGLPQGYIDYARRLAEWKAKKDQPTG